VNVERERGPITTRELRAAWTGARFRRCGDASADAVYLHIRVEADGSVRIERGLVDDHVTPELECVVEVVTTARFGPQTEPTYARLTIYFRPRGPSQRVAAAVPDGRSLRRPSRRARWLLGPRATRAH